MIKKDLVFKVQEKHLHSHLLNRMGSRGISKEEIEDVLNKGSGLSDAKSGTSGKVLVFPFNDEWEGNYFKEKEVRVYYKVIDDEIIILTAIDRYSDLF